MYHSTKLSTPSGKSRYDDTRIVEIKKFYREWKGVPYKFGGTSKSGIDCSALMQILYRERFGVDIPRTTSEQVKVGRKVSSLRLLQPGDLVFFKTGNRRSDWHVGVYIIDNTFMHASSSKGVMVSTIDALYWKKYFWQGRRVIKI